MTSPLLPLQRTADRRGELDLRCPRCFKGRALVAGFSRPRLVVTCRFCAYESLVALRPSHRGPGPVTA
ncbi:MAG: hypothetical protein ACTHN8_04055 [Angustibacter sp.]